jgi:cholesterol oxidase
MNGLTFRETMSGPVALGATDPKAGAADANAATLAIHCEISIDDIDRFVADREHTGSITGSVEYEPFGGTLAVTRGIFNLFSPGGENERLMQYRLAFEHDGKPYFLDGAKHVHDDPGFDVWKDTTTLHTVLHEGSDESGPVAGAGILSLGVEALTRMMTTMRSVGGGVEPLVKFGKVFLGSLWESYGKDKIGGGS